MIAAIKIPLGGKHGRGRFAIIDRRDAALVDGHSWSLCSSPKSKVVYAESRFSGGALVRMHRLIANPPRGFEVDHRNGDGLDNRRRNLRVSTRSRNVHHRLRPRRDNVSGCTGVSWYRREQRWVAVIVVDERRIRIGSFAGYPDAVAARRRAERKYL